MKPVPVWLLAGGMIAALIAGYEWGRYGALVCGIAAAGIGLFAWKRDAVWVWCVVGLLAGTISWQIRTNRLTVDYGPLPRVRVTELPIRIVDNEFIPQFQWLTTPRRIQGEILKWHANSRLPVRLQGRELEDFRDEFTYGHIVYVTGVLAESGILEVEVVKSSGRSEPGMQGRLLLVRNWLLERITRHMKNEEQCATLAALLFGCRGGIAPETREQYVRSGVIHLFSVSGLHIGLLGALILLLCHGCNYSLRHWLGLTVILYVAMCGWQVPAVRAFIMFGVWCVARANLLWTPPLRLLAVAAVIVLGIWPEELWKMGFQFSFLVTGMLLASMEMAKCWRGALNADSSWRPGPVNCRAAVRIPSKFRQKLVLAILSAVVAYLAGSALSLYYQGLFTPEAVLTNLLLIPVVGWLYPIAGLEVLTAGIPGLGVLFAWCQSVILAGMDWVIARMAECFKITGLTRPIWWELWIFYLGMGWWLLGDRKRWAGLTAMGVMTAIWAMTPWFLPNKIGVFQGVFSKRPLVVIAEPAIGRARAFGECEYENAKAAADWLEEAGIREIECFYLFGNNVASWNSAQSLARWLNIRQIEEVTEVSRRNPAAGEKADALHFGGYFANRGVFQRTKSADEGVFDLTNGQVRISLDSKRLLIDSSGLEEQPIELRAVNEMQKWEFDLE